MYANYFETLKENATIKFTKYEKNSNIMIMDNYYFERLYDQEFITKIGYYKLVYSFEFSKESIIYFAKNYKDLKFYYFEYNFDITPQEIININSKKFNEISDQIFIMKEKKTYIFIVETPEFYSNYYFLINTKNIEKDITISNNNRYLYLSQKDLIYNLNLYSITTNIYLKLDSLTLESEIEILEVNITLNKENRYFYVDKNIDKLSLKIKNNNPALIEFLYELSNINSLDTNKNEFNITKGNYLLKYKKSDKIKSIKVNLVSNYNLTLFILGVIGKDNYLGSLPKEESFNYTSITSELIIPNDKLIDNDTFNILITIDHETTLKLELNKIPDDTDKKEDPVNNDKDEGLPTWALIVIIIVAVLIIIIAIVLILRYCKKGHVDSDDIEKEKLLNSNEREI